MFLTSSRISRCLFGISILLLLAPAASAQVLVVEGVSVTGPNSLFGIQVVDRGDGPGAPATEMVAAYNPDGPDPIPLTPDHPMDTVLATMPTSDVEPQYRNIPLLDVPTNIDSGLLERTALPRHLDRGAFDLTQAWPAQEITLGDWLKGSGVATFRCGRDGIGTANIRVFDLLPNRLYTLWASFSGGPGGAKPFGGAPNVIMTDRSGNGWFFRKLNFCAPEEVDEEGNKLELIFVVFHSDQQNYAGVPHAGDLGFPPGLVVHPQLQFSLVQ